MNYVQKTMIVPSALAAQARGLYKLLGVIHSPWPNAFSDSGALPATHWVGHGSVESPLGLVMSDPAILAGASGIPLASAEAILGACTLSDDGWEQVTQEAGITRCELININTATAAEIEVAPGIGLSTAQAIIDMRPWLDVYDLDKVSGIGTAKLAELTNWYCTK